MLDSWQRARSNSRLGSRIRSASQAGLVARAAGRMVARRLAAVGQPSMAGVGLSAGAAGLAAAAFGARNRRNTGVSARYSNGSMGGGIIRTRLKRRTRKRKVNRVPAVLRKVVAKSAKRAVGFSKQKLGEWYRHDMQQIASAVNKVSWELLEGASDSSWLPFLQSEQLLTAADGTTAVVTQEPQDLISSAAGQKKYMIKRTVTCTMKNNSNSPAEVTIYKFRCSEATNNSPETDLDNRITASYFTVTTTATSTPAAPLAKEDNFNQYWTTKNMKQAEWKMKQKMQVLLAGGDEYRFTMIMMVPINLRNSTAVTYQTGQDVIYTRIMGRPTHSAATTSNVGIANTIVDILVSHKTEAYSYKSPVVLSNFRTLANTGFTTMADPVVGGDAIVGPVDAV